MRLLLLLLLVVVGVVCYPFVKGFKASFDKSFKEEMAKSKDEKAPEGMYYMYFHKENNFTVVKSLNNLNQFKKLMVERPEAIFIREKDVRVVQDLLIEKKYSYLTNVAIISYEDLDKTKKLLKTKHWKRELTSFRRFRISLKSYSSRKAAFRSSSFWELVKEERESSSKVINYEVLLSWKNRKVPSRYSYVGSFTKLGEFEEHFSENIEFGPNLKLKRYNYEEFDSHNALEKQLRKIRSIRPRMSPKVKELVAYCDDFTAWLMRFDSQYGRCHQLARRLVRLRDSQTRSGLRREYKDLSRKYKSISQQMQGLKAELRSRQEEWTAMYSRHLAKIEKY